MPITILIADDHTLVREAWVKTISEDPRFEIIGQCGDGLEAVRLANLLRPDIVIMDINLPKLGGIEATRLICKNEQQVKVIGVSMHSVPVVAKKLFCAGAAGYVTKNSPFSEMFAAITAVYEGKQYLCENIRGVLTTQHMIPNREDEGLNSISRREMEIIYKIRDGLSSREISDMLNVSVKTVEVHRYNILKKLRLKNSVALIDYLNRQGFFFAEA